MMRLTSLALAASLVQGFRAPAPGRVRRGQMNMVLDPVSASHAAATFGAMDPSVLSHAISGLAADAADAAADAAKSGGGPFRPLIGATELAIRGIHDGLKGAGVENPYGASIILFTLGVKALTFPLNAKQLESTTKMQAINPMVKDIQTKFGNNPEKANQMIANLYQEAGVNPLAGCLPSLAQIPIFISLYRAILELSKENALTEPFLWLPSLEGPTYGAEQSEALKWLTTWQDGAPMLGWHDTLCFLSIPVILVVSQKISQKILSSDTQPQPEGFSAALLNVLPFMVGWFSLNVPSGLGVYWIVNNVVTTALSAFLKNKYSNDPALANVLSASGGGAATAAPAARMPSRTEAPSTGGGGMGMASPAMSIVEEETVDVEASPAAGAMEELGEDEDFDRDLTPSPAQKEVKKAKRKAQKKARKAQRKR